VSKNVSLVTPRSDNTVIILITRMDLYRAQQQLL